MFKVLKYSVKYYVDNFNHNKTFVPANIVEAADKVALIKAGDGLGKFIIANKDKIPVRTVEEIDDSSLVGKKKLTISIALVDEDEYYRLVKQDKALVELGDLLEAYEKSSAKAISEFYDKMEAIVHEAVTHAK